MPNAFPTKRWAPWAAAALILLSVVQQWIWLSHASAVETWDDDAGLYRLATCLEDQFRGQTTACFAGAPYPPLIPTVAALHFFISGARGVDMALLSLWPWGVVLGGSLWFGVRKAAGDWAGLAAIALGPVVVWSLHIRGKFYTEVPLAALGVACMVAWVHCERFKKRGPTLILGVCLALGLLAKWSFAFFLGPAMAIAWALGLGSAVRSPRLGWAFGVAVLTTVGLIASGASGRLLGGLAPGVGLGILTAISATVLAKKSPDLLHPEGGKRWVNVGICTLVVSLVAGPWYLSHIGQIQGFLADNMAQKFHGDPIGVVAGSGFYPSVLLTRVLGSPLALLLILGVGMSFRKTHPPLTRWCLLGLCAGILILGILPYRSGRYLVAGLGLVVPIIVIGVARLPRIGTIGSVTLLICGLAHQLSWIPMRSGALHVPHHWPIFTLPEQDLFGNSAQGISQANRDLFQPRWRFLPVASPPISRPVAARELVQATHNSAPGPFLLVVFDPAGRVNANSLETELISTRPSALSNAIPGDIQPTATSIRHWQHQARHPPDSPATASGDSSRWLYIGTAVPSNDQNHQSRVRDLVQMLSAQGWSQVVEMAIEDPYEPTTIQVWGEPQ